MEDSAIVYDIHSAYRKIESGYLRSYCSNSFVNARKILGVVAICWLAKARVGKANMPTIALLFEDRSYETRRPFEQCLVWNGRK